MSERMSEREKELEKDVERLRGQVQSANMKINAAMWNKHLQERGLHPYYHRSIIMARRVWECETCKGSYPSKPWKCPVCGVETCELCFDRYAVCKSCAAGKTDDELRIL